MDAQQEFFAQLAGLLARFNMAAPAAIDDMIAYPKHVTHKGVTYYLYAPLAPEYEPSPNERMYGSPEGRFVYDPSNAVDPDSGQRRRDDRGNFPALRSPGGFPLSYGLEADPNDPNWPPTQRRIVSRLAPRIWHGGNVHDSEADALSWKDRVAASKR